jgi:uncharacterized protein (DUF924 family)
MTVNDTNARPETLDPKARELLDAWFADTVSDPGTLAARLRTWFGTDPSHDALLRTRFEALVRSAAAGGLAAWSATQRGRLARILLLDQLPRNCFRGGPAAFASDAQALAETDAGLARGDDRALHPVERLFFCMPLQHAEDAAVQDRSVACFAALAAAAPSGTGAVFDDVLQFARVHRDIVRRFGRFPHRNVILGRESTAEELAWLAAAAPDFGQAKH